MITLIDSLKVKCVTLGDLANLELLHPLVFKNIDRGEHQPPACEQVTSCPDIREDFPVYFYIAENENVIASCQCKPDILYHEGSKYRWAWGGGFLVDPKCRGKGIGKKLIKESTRVLHNNNIGRGSVFSTSVALHILNKLGFSLPGFAKRFVFFKNTYPILKRRLKFRSIANYFDTIYRMCFRLTRPIISRLIQLKDFRITESDLQLDILSTKTTPLHRVPYHFNDNYEKLRYKMLDGKNMKLFHLVDRHDRPVAYLIIKERNTEKTTTIFKSWGSYRLMTIMDYGVYNSSQDLSILIINSALNIFLRSRAEILEIISSYPRLHFYARRIGMIKLGGMSFSYSVPNHWQLGEAAKDTANWPLTHFCGDAYTFG